MRNTVFIETNTEKRKMIGQTADGRAVTETRTIGGHLQEKVEYVHGAQWHCTCMKAGCEHVRQIAGKPTLRERARMLFAGR